jgi:hypothetical protein
MSKAVGNNAILKCSMGLAPGKLTVLPTSQINVENQPMATIFDNIPNTNIMPFGMCQSIANPAVAAATSAAMGVLTPQPCTPVTPAPWVVGSPTVILGGKPALNKDAKCMCVFAGIIEITNPGPIKTDVP